MRKGADVRKCERCGREQHYGECRNVCPTCKHRLGQCCMVGQADCFECERKRFDALPESMKK